ncbi:RNA-binding S4 domain-containing protein [Sphingomonas sp. MMS24-JH45]
MGDNAMRLDVFLWYARLAKTRGVAQAMAAEGRLRLDGRAVDKAHVAVRVGVLTFAHHGRVRVLRVEALPVRRGPAPEAQACYQELVTRSAGADNENVSHQARSD